MLAPNGVCFSYYADIKAAGCQRRNLKAHMRKKKVVMRFFIILRALRLCKRAYERFDVGFIARKVHCNSGRESLDSMKRKNVICC